MIKLEQEVVNFEGEYLNLSDISDAIYVSYGMKPYAEIELVADLEENAKDMASIGLTTKIQDGKMYVFKPGFDIDKAITNKNFGYPRCCDRKFNGTSASYQRFIRKLKILYLLKGEKALTHFVLVPYVPCSIKCRETRRRNYGGFLKDNYPSVFYEELRELIGTLKGFNRDFKPVGLKSIFK